MKDIFTKIGESITSTVKEMGEQTQKSFDQTVYRTELLGLKNDLKKLYQKLGEEQYTAYIQGDESKVQTVLYNQITNLIHEIEKREKIINDIVSNQKDSFDSYKRDVKTTWDENMAAAQKPEKNKEGFEVMKICENCNTGNHVDATYCIYCGEKF
ncbi:hypothetical protein CS063_13985 [Sporanaerobium hydrogeniformans]|uniref:Uncharacterized protein n=1 Tax=Sporanaerobium hydrogeniformans TaxID=3072179 RepID=A0AC61DAR3_9FIRM|nr:zinc ribbon domain-containing protein [Sporanaerobium hydrogeniformans]PHV69821.1 hypothetical protein CS063_13985 [Sporanaerobium hydrogeniformans]